MGGLRQLIRRDLYFLLMCRNDNSHRFFIETSLFGSLHRTISKGATMLDLVMLAIGFAFFALTIGYAVACDHL